MGKDEKKPPRRWLVVLEDRPEKKGEKYLTKKEIATQFRILEAGLSMVSFRLEEVKRG